MPQQRAPRVLVVDHPVVQAVIHNILEPQGYSVSDATPAEAMRLLSSQAADWDLLITNTRDCVVATPASLPVLCLSSAPASEFRVRCASGRCRLMRKPFLAHDLVEAVRGLLAGAAARGTTQ